MLVHLRYRVPPADVSGFESAYRRGEAALRRAPGCRDVELSRGLDDPDRHVLRIRWTAAEDELAFRSSPEGEDFSAALGPWAAMIEDTTRARSVSAEPPALLEWAGGESAVVGWFETFYRRVPDDAVLGPVFAGMPPDHHEHVAMWITEVLGGPRTYTEQRGGHLGMIRHHLGRQLNETQRRRWLKLLMQTADDVGLPADPEFRASIVAYLEWGTRLALVFSATDDEPVITEPVPRWDWVRPPWVRPADSDGSG